MALIKCPECSKEISDTVKKCPNCGYRLKLWREDENQLLKNFNWRKILLIVFIVVVVASGGITFYFYLNSPVRKAQNYLKEGDIKQAQAIFDDEIKSDNKLSIKFEEGLTDVLSSAVDDYAKDSAKYDAYVSLKDFVAANYKNYDVVSYEKQIKEIKASKTSYDEANKAQSDKKYSVAVSKYKKVIERDSNYADAQKQIDQCKTAHKESVLNEINKQISASEPSYKDIESSIKYNDYLENDGDLSAKLTELKEKVKDYEILNAEELAKKNDYLKAFEALKTVPPEYLEDSKVSGVKNNITTAMVAWVTKKASALANKKKYDKAVELLEQYESYDTGNTISNKIESYKKKIKDAVVAEFKALKANLTLKYDSVDRNYTVVNKGYDPEYLNISRSINMEATARVDKKEREVDFMLIAGFQQDDWIFTELVKFASGKYRVTYPVSYSDRYTQVLNYGGGICEWVYLTNLTYSEVYDIDNLVSKITTSKKATVRFEADGNGSRNHTITSSEKNNIKKVYKFCQLLEKYDYLYKYI